MFVYVEFFALIFGLESSYYLDSFGVIFYSKTHMTVWILTVISKNLTTHVFTGFKTSNEIKPKHIHVFIQNRNI